MTHRMRAALDISQVVMVAIFLVLMSFDQWPAAALTAVLQNFASTILLVDARRAERR